MRQSRPLLPIRSLELPARLGRRQRLPGASATSLDARLRFARSNLAVARASRPSWLRGPLFNETSQRSLVATVRHAA